MDQVCRSTGIYLFQRGETAMDLFENISNRIVEAMEGRSIVTVEEERVERSVDCQQLTT